MALTVRTPDGRDLEVLDAGPADGLPLVFHFGTPQGAVPHPLLERAAAERGIRVISYSRPGYGASSPQPLALSTATVADDARDTARILDELGVDQFLTMGWSGGGPRALACAAVLPERCLAAACCVGIAPAAEFEGDLTEGMGEENIAEYATVFRGPEALERLLNEQAGVFGITAGEVAASLGDLVPQVDKDALTGELAEHLAASFRAAGRQGIVGWRDDDLTHTRAWGFDLGAIRVPVAIWQGTDDRMVPLAHARWLAEHVRGARPHLVEHEGHLSLMSRLGDILDDLMELGGVSRS
jgi:pimeloyl-ACP methyl ester carboxylesterase